MHFCWSFRDSRVENRELASEEIVRKQIDGWDTLSALEQRQKRVECEFDLLRSFDLKTYVYAGAMSAVGFFVSSGEGYLLSAFDLVNAEDGLDEEEYRRALMLKILTRSFTLITRILGLVGLWWLMANKHFEFLTLCLGSIAYFVVIHGFVGWSRFRIGVEVPLLVLATLGCVALQEMWAARHSSGRPTSPHG